MEICLLCMKSINRFYQQLHPPPLHTKITNIKIIIILHNYYKLKLRCVLGYYGRTGVLSGMTIVIVHLIPEPKLSFYITIAEVRQVTHILVGQFLEGYKIKLLGSDDMSLYTKPPPSLPHISLFL